MKKTILLLFLAVVSMGLVACKSNSAKVENFPTFTAQDMNGNKVTNDIFNKSKLSVVNFWFTGCEACIGEMPELEKLSTKLKEKDVQLIGICTDANNEDYKAEAKKILEKNGVTFTNLAMDSNSEIDSYLKSIVAFPTTIIVNSEGKIVGETIIGGLDDEKQIEKLMTQIDENLK